MLGHPRPRSEARNEGFSLIEVAIGLTILGLLLVPVIHLYSVQVAQKPWSNTSGNVSLVSSAISNFYINNGRYPCPANPALARNNPNYGLERRNPAGKCIAGGTCTNGVCRATNGYDTDNNGTPDDVLIGSVPIASLGLTKEGGLDGYHNKLVYMVTDILTDTSTFDEQRGAIIVRNIEVALPLDDGPDNADIIPQSPPPEKGAHYAVLSYGVDGRGAINADGHIGRPCAAAGIAKDSENCNNDAIILWDRDRGDYDKGDTPNHYDDYSMYATSYGSGYWSTTPGTSDNIMNTNLQNIGINNNTPTERLDVKGNIRATNQAQTSDFCNIDATRCFDPEVIAGTMGVMVCPDGQAMTGIADGIAVCKAFAFTTTLPPNQDCLTSPAGPYVVGINPVTGILICGP